MDKEDAWFVVVFGVMGMVLSAVISAGMCNSIWMADAVKCDIGEYVINPKTGESRFAWKTSNQPLPESKPKD
jgi:hypothetical protein